ncbi:restriction endonuclease [Micromonospora sp. M51]|uniref:restriction endonuclease n=1 Tax=Micromonospora sp. M51 TaxID=2824889 RepID=UPI001B35D8FE|nr:restriction endonuclease [Micromonospora sp. M51]MBQ1009580.1 restriction endonuclease [Micromonospora sp. M51]
MFTVVVVIGSYNFPGIAEAALLPDRVFFVILLPLFPLSVARFAAGVRLDGDTEVKGWAVAWVSALGAAAVLFFGYMEHGQAIVGTLLGLCSIAQVAALAICMFIPIDQRFEDEVVLPRILKTHVPPAEGKDEVALTDYRDAEKMAAAWLRRFGYPDAEVTPVGPDNGIDVAARGAVAQVKLWHTKRVGISEVQRLAGLTKPGQQAFFFARSGYTKKAEEWASDPSHRVALFELDGDGNLRAANFTALRALYKAPFRMPRSNRDPLSVKFKAALGSIFIFGMVTIPIMAAFILTSPGVKLAPSLLLLAAMWLLYFLGFTVTLRRDFRRLTCAMAARWRGEAWPGWGEILTEPVAAGRDDDLPPGLFAGYLEKGGLGALISIVEGLVFLRKAKEWALCRTGISRRPKAPFGIGELMAVGLLMDMGRIPGRRRSHERR